MRAYCIKNKTKLKIKRLRWQHSTNRSTESKQALTKPELTLFAEIEKLTLNSHEVTEPGPRFRSNS